MSIRRDFSCGQVEMQFFCGDLLQINIFDLVLTEDVPGSKLHCNYVNKVIVFRLKQDAEGGHQFAWPSNVQGGDEVALEPFAITQQMFLFDGQNAWPIAPAWTSAKPAPLELPVIQTSDAATPAATREKRNWLKSK